jgi:hypothetical protein
MYTLTFLLLCNCTTKIVKETGLSESFIIEIESGMILAGLIEGMGEECIWGFDSGELKDQEDLDVYGKIILQCFRAAGWGGVWTEFFWFRMVTSG